MDESTSTALAPVSGGEVSTPPPSSPEPSTPSQPLEHDRSAVTGDQASYYIAPADNKIVAPANDPAPPTLLKSGKVNPAWSEWMIRNLPKPQTARRTPKQPAVDKAYKDYGFSSNDEARQVLTLVRDLDTPTGASAVLNAIIARSPETFERIRNHVIADNPHLALKQSALLLGWDMDAEVVPDNDLPLDLQRLIPPDLVPIARTIPTGLLYEWANADSLAYNLHQEARIADQWNEQTAEFNESWDKAITEATKAGEERLNELRDQYTAEHQKELAKWKPSSDEKTNAALRHMAFAGARDALLSDPKFRAMDEAIDIMLRDAPMWHIHGESGYAEQSTRDAHQLVRQTSVRLGQLLRERVKMLDNLIKSSMAHAAEKAIESVGLEPLAPLDEKRSLRPGEPPRLDKSGKVSKSWLDWVGKKVLTRGGEQNATT